MLLQANAQRAECKHLLKTQLEIHFKIRCACQLPMVREGPFVSLKNSEYDQEIPQLQTTDKPMALRGINNNKTTTQQPAKNGQQPKLPVA